MLENSDLKITAVRHSWREDNPNFRIDRPSGFDDYVFIHLHNSVKMTLNGESFVTKPYACVIYDKQCYQCWKPVDGYIVHDWMHISGDLPRLLSEIGLEFNKVYYPITSDFITKICAELEVEFFAEKKFSDIICRAELYKLFCLISRKTFENDPYDIKIDKKSAQMLQSLRTEILTDLGTQRSGAELAKRLSVSESKFYVMYKSMFGISPQKDIIHARIEKAKLYLASGAYSVEETAFLLGYTNTFHFIRQFKQMTGKTPGEYKYRS